MKTAWIWKEKNLNCVREKIVFAVFHVFTRRLKANFAGLPLSIKASCLWLAKIILHKSRLMPLSTALAANSWWTVRSRRQSGNALATTGSRAAGGSGNWTTCTWQTLQTSTANMWCIWEPRQTSRSAGRSSYKLFKRRSQWASRASHFRWLEGAAWG